MAPEPQVISNLEIKPEERAMNIAAELAYDILSRPDARSSYRFQMGDRTVEVRLETGVVADQDTMYIAVNPPGQICSCCKGSGKRNVSPPTSG